MTTRRKPFCGVDGEGSTFARHEYMLLRAGEFVLNTGEALTPYECLYFLAMLPTGREYVSYFFDYDVTMMTRDMPEDTLYELMDRESRARKDGRGYRPVKWKGFEFDWLPRKEFKVRHPSIKSSWSVVSDVGTFFQCSFVAALRKWGIGSAEVVERIAEGKSQRANFGAMTPEIVEYNRLECDLLEDLMETFRRLCEQVGYVPRKWQGPGQMAIAMFEKHGIPKRADIQDRIPAAVWKLAQQAYYGGRFETTAVGWVE